MSPSSSSMGGSHGLALAATAMALSGTLVLISLCRNRLLHPDAAPPAAPPLRPCITSEKRRRGKGQKRVHFAEDVVDNGGGGSRRSPPRRRAAAEAAAAEPCRGAAAATVAMPANREALYRGMLRDRSMLRVACSY